MISLQELHLIIDVPLAFTFLAVGILLSIMTQFPQLRKFNQFWKFIRSKQSHESHKNTITPLEALFTAMSTSLGMGTIVAAPLGVVIGGPGSLFWIMVYSFFGAVTKFTEATFAVKYKRYAKDGTIIGGPTGYLYQLHPLLANWYGILTVFLFSSWTAIQAKAMAATYSHQGVPEHITGLIMASFVFYILTGGAKRIGFFSSKLVPVMCIMYFTLCCLVIFADLSVLQSAIMSIFKHAFTPAAPIGGFVGATVFTGLKEGVFKAAFITEAGVGTAAIPHALSDAKKPTNQGVLAMYSIIGDTFFCIMSGLVTIITGVWTYGQISNDLPLHAFKAALPNFGPLAYTATVTLFIIGTAIGNSLNASKSYAFFTNNRWMYFYYGFVSVCIFFGAVFDTRTLWDISELLIPLIAIPNLFGLLVLTKQHRTELSE